MKVEEAAEIWKEYHAPLERNPLCPPLRRPGVIVLLSEGNLILAFQYQCWFQLMWDTPGTVGTNACLLSRRLWVRIPPETNICVDDNGFGVWAFLYIWVGIFYFVFKFVYLVTPTQAKTDDSLGLATCGIVPIFVIFYWFLSSYSSPPSELYLTTYYFTTDIMGDKCHCLKTWLHPSPDLDSHLALCNLFIQILDTRIVPSLKVVKHRGTVGTY